MLFRVKHLSLATKIAVGASLIVAAAAHAAPVVATPGSVATYTYFPPASQAGGGSGSGTGEDVSTLQRCLWAPSSGDQTVSVATQFNYSKPITLYYRLVGDNGGAGGNGGGGGSTAIVLNGTVAALGKGGDAGQSGTEVSGTISIKAGDSLRFVTGGGGGDGMTGGYGLAIGGGGGAGYTGGGGGGSLPSRSYTAADSPSIGGKGGSTTPGAGGTASGGTAGTAGSGMSGGIATFSNGSTAPTGTVNTQYTAQWGYYSSIGLYTSVTGTKYPATASNRGAPVGVEVNPYYWSGGGGKLGVGGSIAFVAQNSWWCEGARASITQTDDWDYADNNAPCSSYYNTYRYLHGMMSKYPAHTADMRLTRGYPAVTNTGYLPIEVTGGSLPGQIITMYQAPVCSFLQ